jgi:heterodisulfide reductase subunit A
MALADKKAAGSKAAANMPFPEKGTDVPVSAQEKTGEPAQAGNGKPRIGVFVCHCGSNIAGFLDVEDVTEYSATLPNVVFATRNLYTCAEDGISAIKQAIKEHDLNRVVVASCTPRTHEPLFRAACEEAGLNKYLFEFANIRDQCSWVHMHEWDAATAKAKDLVRMSVMRASLLEPLQEISIDIFPASCIIGAGIAGMTAALSIAAQGYEVYLVEKEAEVGGMLRGLDSLTPTNADPEQIIASYLKRIKAASNIHLYTGARLKAVNGYFGNFDVTVSLGDRDETFKVGTLVVATGAEEMKPDGLYGYGELSNVVTEGQLELMLKEDRLGEIKDAVIIGCVGSRGERVTYCNRICCMVGIKNAIALKEKFPKANVSVLHNDIQVYGVIQEDVYKKARGMGIRFRKYSPERRPQVSADGDSLKVTTWLELMQREVEIPADLVVLSTPLVQTQDGLDLAKMLRVPVGQDKFFFEAHVKLRPVDFATDGIYVCGAAQGPKDIAESIAQAHAAASHAVNPMRKETVSTEAITSSVDPASCIGCGFCAWVCPFGAVEMITDDEGRWVSNINAALCKGCGACAAGCPTLAIRTQHFTEDQTLAQIKAAFPEPSAPGPDFEPQVLAFTCNWCSYAGADLAGVSRFQYPPNVRIIRLMCSARIDPLYVLEAFRHNADAVLMSGCHIGDCHYISANLMTEARFFALKDYLSDLGMDPDRLQLAWISAAEGEKWAEAVKNIVEISRKLGPLDKSVLRYKESERSKV